MKSRHIILVAAALLPVFLSVQALRAQPNISYPAGSHIYALGTGIAPLTPTNTGSSPYAAGLTTTIAGDVQGYYDANYSLAQFNHPIAVTTDASGYIYVCDRLNYRIRKINESTGQVTTVAGNGTSADVDGTGTGASFRLPNSIVTDASGNLYVADEWANKIKKITPAGVVTTFAGNGSPGSANGTGTGASFNYPFGIAIDRAGNLYVAEINNNDVRKITPAGVVTTVASNSTASLYQPLAVAVDAAGTIYVADSGTNRIVKVSSSGVVSTLVDYSGGLSHPAGVAVDEGGNVYVGDENNHMIRKITPSGLVSTLSGTGATGYANGAGSSSTFNLPCNISYANGGVYVADYNNNRIRKVLTGGYQVSPALPLGLSMDAGTGVISGTPQGNSAITAYTVTASNASGSGSAVVYIGTGNTTGFTPSDENFVASFTPRDAYTDVSQFAGLPGDKLNISVTYFDGLGRANQKVDWMASGTGNKDLVTPITYDQYDRETRKYLPYASIDNSGAYKQAATVQQNNYYDPANPLDLSPGVAHIIDPWSDVQLEASALSRSVKQGAPGPDWQIGAHTINSQYGLNDQNDYDVKKWKLSTGGGASWSGNSLYADNVLYRTRITDENGHWTEEYKDMRGLMICRKVQSPSSAGGVAETNYIYDDYGNLTYVVPPVQDNTHSFPQSFTEADNDLLFKNYVYAYHYDSRNRVFEKKLPGEGWEFLIYNDLNQVTFTQDAIQRAKTLQEWTFTRYDVQGRVALTGIWQSGNGPDLSLCAPSRALAEWLLSWSKGHTPVWAYPDPSNPSTGYNYDDPPGFLLAINYYDDYNFPGAVYFPSSVTGVSTRTKGLLTGTVKFKLNPDGTIGDRLLSALYYDDDGNLIETVNQNNLGGIDRIANHYNFNRQLDRTTRVHNSAQPYVNTAIPNLTVTTAYVYDSQGRKSATKMATVANPAENQFTTLSIHEYNEIGQLRTKKLHSISETSFLQSITYDYNERGWLLNMSSGLFQEYLQYNNVSNVPGISPTAQYNGNIASQSWGTAAIPNSKNYIYDYDELNRLRSGTSSTTGSESGITYDNMGNLVHLNRSGSSTPGNFGYHYYDDYSNQLKSVDNLTVSDYTYDANGNMSHDGRNGTDLAYNVLNVPRHVTKTGLNIDYTYTSTGEKLKRSSSNYGTADYDNGIVYENGNLSYIITEEGRLLNPSTTPNYEYALTDHLGNTRITFDNSNGIATPREGTDYYPFGIAVKSNAYNYPTQPNHYLYNKKEEDQDLGDYDYGARFYDPVIARWTSLDPLADVNRRWTPYAYVKNSPINRVDPDGMADQPPTPSLVDQWAMEDGFTMFMLHGISDTRGDDKKKKEKTNQAPSDATKVSKSPLNMSYNPKNGKVRPFNPDLVGESTDDEFYTVRPPYMSWHELYTEWQNANGPEYSLIDNPSNPMIQGLIGSAFEKIGYQEYLKTGKVDHFHIDFGPHNAIWDAITQPNMALQFLGSARISVSPVGNDYLKFQIDNTTDRVSFYYHLPVANIRRYPWITPASQSTVYQRFIWYRKMTSSGLQ